MPSDSKLNALCTSRANVQLVDPVRAGKSGGISRIGGEGPAPLAKQNMVLVNVFVIRGGMGLGTL